MNHKDMIQHSLEYIETHLNTQITAAELADTAGYSLFHFYRLFHAATGFPVMQYILRRRLLHTVYSVQCGNTGIHSALQYGFETYAGFYKAFLREFGCTPQEFIKSSRAKRPCCPNLFTEEYMPVTHKKAVDILKRWGLENEPITDIYYAGTGERNAHALYVGDRFVLKFTANLNHIKNNIALADALQSSGLCSAVPIRTNTGELFIRDGEIYYYLSQRLPGTQTLSADYYAEDGTKNAYFVGSILGQLHGALAKLELPLYEADLLHTLKTHVLQKVQAILQPDNTFCSDLLYALQKLYPQLPRQIVHRDPNPGNIIRDNNTWGFIDFELSERSIRIYDPCYAATAILSESFSDNEPEKLLKWLDIYRSIFLGYDNTVHMTHEERLAVPYILLANQWICTVWFSTQEQYREQFEVNRKMTKWLMEHFDALQLS